MRCICGHENFADSKFCTACGGSLVQPGTPSGAVAAQPSLRPEKAAAVSPPERKQRIALWKPVLACVLVAAAVAGYFWLNRPEPAYKFKPSGLYRVVVDGKWGFIDRTGALVIPATYDAVEDFSEGLAAVRSQDKFGYIDIHGALKIPFQFDAAHLFVNGLASVKLCCGSGFSPNDQWGFIDQTGKYVVNPQFSNALWFNEGLAPVQEGGSWGYVNGKGKFVIPATFTEALAFSEGFAPVDQGGRWGYVDKTGKLVVNPQFEAAIIFKDGLAAVRIGGKWGFIDHSGQYAINPQFSRVLAFNEGAAQVYVGEKAAIVDKSGKFLVNPGQFSSMSIPVGGQTGVSTPNGAGIIDKTGNWLLPPNSALDSVAPLGPGVYRAQIAGEECLIDQAGNVIFGRFKGQSLNSIAAGIESEKQASATLKTLITAQLSYASTYTSVGFADKLTKLGPPPPGAPVGQEHAGLIDAELANGSRNGYQFSLQAESQDGIVSQYSITATPTNFSAGNIYCTDATGAVRFSKSGDACTTNSHVVPNNVP
jgi:hypothetical protein